MNIIPWNKNGSSTSRTAGGPLDMLHREMDRVFDRFFDGPWGGTASLAAPFAGDFAPPLDIAEGDKEITVRAELPGVDPSRIELKVVGDVLTLSGTKEDQREDSGEGFYRSERVFGSFSRSIVLPESVDPDRVNAEFRNGVLNVRMTKKPTAVPRKIAVKSA
ncbi:MAG TPA: Hsp20/alpha crystallin family protein [Phycisphaerales bacterium]|nr:Hsp20/alpha crystallin family protein [Phycisphaerales bacterium]